MHVCNTFIQFNSQSANTFVNKMQKKYENLEGDRTVLQTE